MYIPLEVIWFTLGFISFPLFIYVVWELFFRDKDIGTNPATGIDKQVEKDIEKLKNEMRYGIDKDKKNKG